MKRINAYLKRIHGLTYFRYTSTNSLINYISSRSNFVSKSVNFTINSTYYFYKNIFKKNNQVVFTEEKKNIPNESSFLFGNKKTGIKVDKVLEQNFPNIKKLNCSLIGGNNPKFLNLVTDSIGKESLFGGVATALILATIYCNKNNLPLRIITRCSPANPNDYFNLLNFYQLEKPNRVEFSTDMTPVLLSTEDEFLATSWWSAYSIRQTFPTRKFFYLIQEVETFFYPHGDNHLLCKSIENDENIIFIVNSHFLNDYFKIHNRIKGQSFSFEPAFPKIFKVDKISQKQPGEKNRIFFYARPHNPRNLFWTGLALIDKAIKSGIINTNDWDIYLAGSQQYPDFEFSNGYRPINVGVLDLKKYKKFLGKTDLTISLMYTPHPSYPPYDSLLSGCIVLTNSFENKTHFSESKNIIVTKLDTEDFLNNLDKALKLSCDIEKRSENYANTNISTDWNSNLDKVLRFMNDNIKY